jgi:hypothetical protein
VRDIWDQVPGENRLAGPHEPQSQKWKMTRRKRIGPRTEGEAGRCQRNAGLSRS